MMQDVDSPTYIQPLPQPTWARCPCIEPQPLLLVLGSKDMHRIVPDCRRRRDLGQEPAVGPPEPERAIGLSIDPVALLVHRPMVPATQERQVRQRRGTAVAPVEDDEYERYGLHSGDILICEGGEVGRTAIWKGELPRCYYEKALHRLRQRGQRMSPEFFLYHMMHAFVIRNSYGEVGTVTTIAHLPGVKVRTLPLPVPPASEQGKIAAQLSVVDAKVAGEEKRREALDALFRPLLHELMTGRLRVAHLGDGLDANRSSCPIEPRSSSRVEAAS